MDQHYLAIFGPHTLGAIAKWVNQTDALSVSEYDWSKVEICPDSAPAQLTTGII